MDPKPIGPVLYVAFNRGRETPMWSHLCPEDGGFISTARGEPCNWCGRWA